MPASHHFIGDGPLSERLRGPQEDGAALIADMRPLVRVSGLEILAEQAVPLDHGGTTLVWVLAESHLVVHVWPARDFATIDLHVCDDRSSQLLKAVRLRDALDGFCFPPGTGTWHATTAGR